MPKLCPKKFFGDPYTYLFALCASLSLLYIIFDIIFAFDLWLKLLLALSLVVLLYAIGMLYCKRRGKDTRRLMPAVYAAILALYVYFLISVTLIDATFGRNLLSEMPIDTDSRTYYNMYYVNLIPFETVKNIYINALIKGYLSAKYVALNFFGNLFVLMPLALLLPSVCSAFRRSYIFLPSALALTLAIEAAQYTLMCGSCDIDDVILNFSGALIAFLLLKIPLFKKLCDKVMFRADTP